MSRELTSDKAKRLINNLRLEQEDCGLTLKEEMYLQALEMALKVMQTGTEERAAGDPEGVLEAFDNYARQFTYNNHPAKPEMFPKGYPFFEAGYRAAMLAAAPAFREISHSSTKHFRESAESSTNGWIKCSERMPEENGRYWCYVEEQNSLGKSHYQWNCSWNGDEWGGEALSGRVTHWMPLPAPPSYHPIDTASQRYEALSKRESK